MSFLILFHKDIKFKVGNHFPSEVLKGTVPVSCNTSIMSEKHWRCCFIGSRCSLSMPPSSHSTHFSKLYIFILILVNFFPTFIVLKVSIFQLWENSLLLFIFFSFACFSLLKLSLVGNWTPWIDFILPFSLKLVSLFLYSGIFKKNQFFLLVLSLRFFM